MFVVLIISFDNFLIGPDGKGPQTVVDPGSLVIQETSISGAPSVVLAGFVYFMGRGYNSKQAGIILIASGIVMMAGMAAVLPLIPRIPSQYVVGGVDTLPYAFIPIGAAISAVGGLLAVMSKKREARNLDDLR
jgi:hypothetical protein